MEAVFGKCTRSNICKPFGTCSTHTFTQMLQTHLPDINIYGIFSSCFRRARGLFLFHSFWEWKVVSELSLFLWGRKKAFFRSIQIYNSVMGVWMKTHVNSSCFSDVNIVLYMILEISLSITKVVIVLHTVDLYYYGICSRLTDCKYFNNCNHIKKILSV